MAEGFFRKMTATTFVAATDHDAKILSHLKVGDVGRFKAVKVRNYPHLQKFMVMVNLAFDAWEPIPSVLPGQENWIVEKNKEAFRKDLTIKAGFSHTYYRLDGTLRVEAKSLAFDYMGQDEFEEVYTAVISVVIKYVMTNYTDETLRATVIKQIEAFE